MFKKSLWGLLALVVVGMGALSFVAARQPTDFRITRSLKITAPASVVFEQVNNLRKWEAWSPWAKMDPVMKKTFEGPEAGVGAIHGWAGNSDVGVGKMSITQSRPSDLIVMRLDFKEPMQATNTAEFTFKPEGSQTIVTWTMSGQNNFVAKVFGVLFNIDAMVGGEFEKGLAQLKAVSEKAAPL
jgi:uncharacterized protein YndB with AHSA1/START domain